MDSGIQKSILQMARGAIQERADYEMSSLLNNILDPNTSATAARKLTITLTLKPDDTRQNITVSCVATSKLAATNPVTTPCTWLMKIPLLKWYRRFPVK